MPYFANCGCKRKTTPPPPTLFLFKYFSHPLKFDINLQHKCTIYRDLFWKKKFEQIFLISPIKFDTFIVNWHIYQTLASNKLPLPCFLWRLMSFTNTLYMVVICTTYREVNFLWVKKNGVKTEDLWNFWGQKSLPIIIPTRYIDRARKSLLLHII